MIKALNMSKSFYKGKRICIEVAKIKEMWVKGEVKTIQWIPGKYQLADGQTKKEASKSPLFKPSKREDLWTRWRGGGKYEVSVQCDGNTGLQVPTLQTQNATLPRGMFQSNRQ